MAWQWWIKNLLHLETLFMIGLAITLIYIFCFTKGKVNTKKFEDIFVKPQTSYGSDGVSVGGFGKKEKKPKKIHKHEERCREIFTEIFGKKFKSERPDWLENPVSGDNLELDGVNYTIPTRLGRGLAFEYDGRQHSEYDRYFHRGGPKEFEYQVKKDQWKDLKCKEQGILLIRIPHFVPYQDLDRYIMQRLRKEGLGHYLGGGNRGESDRSEAYDKNFYD